MNKKLLISILVLVILGLAVGSYFWWVKYYKKPAPSPVEQATSNIQKTVESINQSAAQDALIDIDAVTINPMENVPDVNPYDDTNPFSNIKTNPFQ